MNKNFKKIPIALVIFVLIFQAYFTYGITSKKYATIQDAEQEAAERRLAPAHEDGDPRHSDEDDENDDENEESHHERAELVGGDNDDDGHRVIV